MVFRMSGRKKAAQTGARRTAIPIALTPRVNEVVNAWCDRTGGSKTRFVERLVEFWAAAPDSVQRLMLGDVPSDLREEVVDRAASYFGDVAARAGVRPEISESGEPGGGAKRYSPPAGPSATEDSNGASHGGRHGSGGLPAHPRGRPR